MLSLVYYSTSLWGYDKRSRSDQQSLMFLLPESLSQHDSEPNLRSTYIWTSHGNLGVLRTFTLLYFVSAALIVGLTDRLALQFNVELIAVTASSLDTMDSSTTLLTLAPNAPLRISLGTTLLVLPQKYTVAHFAQYDLIDT